MVPNPQVASFTTGGSAPPRQRVFTEWCAVATYEVQSLDDVLMRGPPGRPHQLRTSSSSGCPLPAPRLMTCRSARTRTSRSRWRPRCIRDAVLASDHDNDQYYWRVRPVDNFGNKRDWNAVTTWTFRRHWPDQPELEYPENNSTVGDPFFYQWTPVDHASDYTIQLSRSSDFNTFEDQCSTVHTTYVPTKNTDCWPGAAGGTYYWRVIATDAPGRTVDGDDIVTDGIVAEVGRFTMTPLW